MNALLRSVKHFSVLTYRAFRRHLDSPASLLAGAIAYFALLSAAPVMLIAAGLARRLLSAPDAQARLLGVLERFLTPEATRAAGELLESSAESDATGGAFTWGGVALAGVLLTLYAGTRLFVQMRHALHVVWEIDDKRKGLLASVQGALMGRLRAFALLALCGFIATAQMALLAGLGALTRVAPNLLTESTLGKWLGRGLEYVVLLPLLSLLILAVYRFLPAVRYAYRDLIPGAVCATLLFAACSWAIKLYFSTLGTSHTAGALGSLALVMLWFYFGGHVFLAGAHLAHLSHKIRHAQADHGSAPVSLQGGILQNAPEVSGVNPETPPPKT